MESEFERNAYMNEQEDLYHVYHAAKMIRAHLSKVDRLDNPMSWPPSPDQICTENVLLPDALYNFLV